MSGQTSRWSANLVVFFFVFCFKLAWLSKMITTKKWVDKNKLLMAWSKVALYFLFIKVDFEKRSSWKKNVKVIVAFVQLSVHGLIDWNKSRIHYVHVLKAQVLYFCSTFMILSFFEYRRFEYRRGKQSMLLLSHQFGATYLYLLKRKARELYDCCFIAWPKKFLLSTQSSG